jgi:hypothetical protein
MIETLRAAPSSVLRAIAAAVRTGQLKPPLTPFAVRRVVSCDEAPTDAVQQLAQQLPSPLLRAAILDLAASASEGRCRPYQSDLAPNHNLRSPFPWVSPELLAARCVVNGVAVGSP